MPNQDREPTADELAAIEAELPEWERLAVQDYWAAVVNEELEAAQPGLSYRWAPQGPGERQRERRTYRRTGNTVLRQVTESLDTAAIAITEHDIQAAA